VNPQQVPVTHRDCYWQVFTGTLWILASVGTPPWMFNNVRLFDTLWSRVHGTWKQTLVGGLGHFLFFHVLGIVIPTDFHIFRGVYTTNQNSFGWHSRGFWAISHWEVHPRRGTPWDDVDRSADHPAHCHTCTVCEYMVCAHMEYLVYIYIYLFIYIIYHIYIYLHIYTYIYTHMCVTYVHILSIVHIYAFLHAYVQAHLPVVTGLAQVVHHPYACLRGRRCENVGFRESWGFRSLFVSFKWFNWKYSKSNMSILMNIIYRFIAMYNWCLKLVSLDTTWDSEVF